jgi:formiminotetrahydrofolate cyclodeaminase
MKKIYRDFTYAANVSQQKELKERIYRMLSESFQKRQKLKQRLWKIITKDRKICKS